MPPLCFSLSLSHSLTYESFFFLVILGFGNLKGVGVGERKGMRRWDLVGVESRY